MDRNLLYLINPISGTKNKEGLIDLIKVTTGLQNIPFQLLDTHLSGDYTFLKQKIRKDKITDVIVCGGDGTINKVAAALMNTGIPIGIIPMGSGNGLALAAGISRDPAKALKIIFKGNASSIDGFYINNSFSCMLCGLGFDALVAQQFAVHPSRGLKTYVRLTILNFLKAITYPFEIMINDISITTDAFFISIANSNQFGNNFTIAPKASLSDGLLDIIIVNKMSKLRLVYTILKQVTAGEVQMVSKKYHQTGIQYFQAKELTIKNPFPAPLHIDGDPAETSTYFRIKIVQKAIMLLQP
ncbi:MAG: diacylglycerol kinase family protein [Ferruginibacter sp.]